MKQAMLPYSQPVFYILLVLAIQDAHGYEIMKKVRQYSENHITLGPGTLYGAIKRLLADGLIEENGVSADGERRRVYHITDSGRHIVGQELDRMDSILSLARHANILGACLDKD